MTAIDLDAVLGELEPHPLTYKTREFTLPAELPGAALAPFMSADLGLVDLLTDVMDAQKTIKVNPENGEVIEVEDGWIDTAVRVLRSRPSLPVELLEAGKASLTELLNAEGEQAEAFFALKPSVNAYFALAQRIVSLYGFGVTDFFGSPDSSQAGTGDGEPSKVTSPDTSPESTPAASSDDRLIPASSEPAASSS